MGGKQLQSDYNHDIPRLRRSNGASHLKDHATQQPEEATNAMLALVVGRNGNVHMAHWRVSVTECNHRNVSESCFPNWLQQQVTKSGKSEFAFLFAS
jgi:hypothetical protein